MSLNFVYTRKCLLESLQKQADAHADMNKINAGVIAELEEKLEREWNNSFTTHMFMQSLKDRDFIEKFVEFTYTEKQKTNFMDHANLMDCVAFFHDETLDLSTIPCTGDDFKPWR